MNKIKAQWMAQYLGQNVMVPAPATTAGELTGNALSSYLCVGTNYLLLRTVDMLTDEEAIQTAKTMYSFPDWIDNTIPFVVKRYPYLTDRDPGETDISFTAITMGKTQGKYHLKIYDNFGFYLGYETSDMLKTIPLHGYLPCTDYLRAIGILTPFTYLNELNQPVTLSVKDLIEKGWVKIK